MNVAVGRLNLRLPGNQSLKGKRGVSRSIIARVRSRFNVAMAEVDDNQLWQRLTLGISAVSNDGQHATEVLSKVVRYIEEMRLDVEVLDYEVETVSGI